MRWSLLVLTLTAVVAVHPAPFGKTWVFLIAGQSNSVGLNSDGGTIEDVADDRIKQLTCCTVGLNILIPLDFNKCRIEIATNPLHHYCTPQYLKSTNVGFGLSFAKKLLSTLPATDTIALVPAGMPVTGFTNHLWTAESGILYFNAVAKLKRTMELLQLEGQKTSFEGILWHQGEYDSGDNLRNKAMDGALYIYECILPVVNSLRDATFLPFTSATVPFVAGNFVPAWATNASHPERRMLYETIPTLEYFIPYSASVSSIGLVGDPLQLSRLSGEKIHFTATSQRIFGKRYYDGWLLAKDNTHTFKFPTDT